MHLAVFAFTLSVYLVVMVLIDALHPLSLTVDPAPKMSLMHHEKTWNVFDDPWVKVALKRQIFNQNVIRFVSYQPIAYWQKYGYMRDDGFLVSAEFIPDLVLPEIEGDTFFAEKLAPIVRLIYRQHKIGKINLSQVGTLKITLNQGREFLLGRDQWLQQYKKMAKMLVKYPDEHDRVYDLRYKKGFSVKARQSDVG